VKRSAKAASVAVETPNHYPFVHLETNFCYSSLRLLALPNPFLPSLSKIVRGWCLVRDVIENRAFEVGPSGRYLDEYVPKILVSVTDKKVNSHSTTTLTLVDESCYVDGTVQSIQGWMDDRWLLENEVGRGCVLYLEGVPMDVEWDEGWKKENRLLDTKGYKRR